MKLLGALPAVLLLLLFITAVWGSIARQFKDDQPAVRVWLASDKHPSTLIVMVPGLHGEKKNRVGWADMIGRLRAQGDVAVVDYPNRYWSNAKGELIAQEINVQVQAHWEKKKYTRVILVGNSLGALLIRKALLYSQGAAADGPRTPTAWSTHVERLVLLAGINRGWDLSGEKPADMRWYHYYLSCAAAWFGNLAHIGLTTLQMEAGAPFVANLRLDWMHWVRRSPTGQGLMTVQLLGDIDEIVSAADNADLRVSGQGENFVWLKVRGTGHADIVDINESGDGKEAAKSIGDYRLEKFLSAIQLPRAALRQLSEELPYRTDDQVMHVVFVMHGIRDLGKWSSGVEEALQLRFAPGPTSPGKQGKLAIASVRYGYFGMGQFLIRHDRQKYVRWFMDQYTETLARYPQVTDRIDFIGHSNGTYLLGEALQKYPSMKVRRVVLGGSVLPTNFDWKTIFDNRQVTVVRNYVAYDDWVVALFPRFFEPKIMQRLGNDIGSAGFNGFDAIGSGPGPASLENVRFIKGHHAAFLGQLPSIADFLMAPDGVYVPATSKVGDVSGRRWYALKWVSDWFTWLVWLPLVAAIVWLGSRVAGSAGHLSAAALVIYLVLLFQVLRWI